MKRRRYQNGSLTKKSNRFSEDVSQFRFYETTPEGRRYRELTSVGPVAQYPTKSDAPRVIELHRTRLNLYHRFGRPVWVGALMDHYFEHELPERRHSTQQISFLAVEEWLRSLALAPKTKVNLRGLFHSFMSTHDDGN